MGVLWTFLLALFGVSAMIYLAARLFGLFHPRADQWPLLWATGLGLSVLIPALGLLLPALPHGAAQPAFDALSLHEPLQSVGLLSATVPDAADRFAMFTLANGARAMIAVYLLGVGYMAAKLAWGRYSIRRIIAAAVPVHAFGSIPVLRSPSIPSPFAYTPLGRPDQSRIVIPQAYPTLMSAESLTDILTHEREHIARRDDECGLVLRVLLCMCWISPFAHSLFAQWSQSTEIRCDMAVTTDRDPEMRKAYAETLLRALHIMAGRVRQYPAASFSTHRIRNEKMRITHIMAGRRPTFKRRRDHALLGVAASMISVVGMISISATAHAEPKAVAAVPTAEAAPADEATPETVAPKAKKKTTSSAMVSGRLSSTFGLQRDIFKEGKAQNHRGVDIAAATGTPIYAPANGVVRAATDLYNGKPKYGTVVVLETEGGVMTMFAHLDAFMVQEGQRVTKGAQLATVGNSGKSTGPHVHIETSRAGKLIDPMDVWVFETE